MIEIYCKFLDEIVKIILFLECVLIDFIWIKDFSILVIFYVSSVINIVYYVIVDMYGVIENLIFLFFGVDKSEFFSVDINWNLMMILVV